MSDEKDLSTILDGVKAIIFDLDGTLIDSMWMWEQIDKDYLAEYGIDLPDDLQASISGMSSNETAAYFANRFPEIPQTQEEMKATWNAMAWDRYEHVVTLKPGVLDFLKFVRSKGIRTGIATSNSPELVEMVTRVLGIDEYLEEVHNCSEVAKGKPSPLIYLYVAECLGVDPKDCLIFEDLCVGLQAGIAAGMKTCGVYDENSHDETDRKHQMADYYINDFNDLISVIK